MVRLQHYNDVKIILSLKDLRVIPTLLLGISLILVFDVTDSC